MTKKISIISLFVSFAVILSYVESFIPVIGIPGVKLGLANLAVIITLYLMGAREALLVNILRIVIVGALFGNFFSIIYSVAGAVFSFVIMCVAKYTKILSIITVAVLGGVFHNIGQVIIAGIVIETYSVVVYIPILILSGLITGAVIGILSSIIYKRTEKLFTKL